MNFGNMQVLTIAQGMALIISCRPILNEDPNWKGLISFSLALVPFYILYTYIFSNSHVKVCWRKRLE